MTAPVYAWAVKGPDGIDPNTITDTDWRAKKLAEQWTNDQWTYTAVKVRVSIEEVTDDQ